MEDRSSRRLQKYYQSLHPLTREAHLLLNKSSVYSGRALERLLRAPFDGWNFQEIRKLKLQFYYYDWFDEKRREIEEEDLAVAPTVKANINEFVCRIKQMVPTLREIEVEYGLDELELDPENDFFDTLLEPLLHLAPHIVYRTPGDKVEVKVSMNDISNLVCIDMEADDMEPIAHLAQRSAATLEYLCLLAGHGQYGSAFELLRDANGDYVCYSRLRVFKMEYYADFKWYDHPVLPSAASFPILRTLSLVGCYPFNDDVLFRGNAATLESLVLKTDHDDIVKLVEFGVFTPTSHLKLQCTLLSIVPNAAVRSFSCSGSQPDISSVISIFGEYPNIQVLSSPEVYLSLWDAITLIKSLLLLSDLDCRTSYLIQLPANVKEKDFPAYVLTKYAPMGQRFRCWHITETCRSVTTTAWCVLLLALICPNFDYCAPPEKEFREYMDKLEKTIDLDGFKDYAPHLLKALPALVELGSSISDLGSELDIIAIDELPDYVASTYCDAGKNLQVWSTNIFDSQSTFSSIDYILLLALACSKLWQIQLLRGSIQDIQDMQDIQIKIADALNERYLIKMQKLDDLEMWPNSDMTVIGENGINISGGQRARLALARTVYSQADIYFLDDPLSAVDAIVKRHILDNIILSTGLLGNKLRFVTTHADNILPLCNQIATVDNGSVSVKVQTPQVHTAFKFNANGKIEFHDFSMKYGADLGYALRNLNLTINPGEKIGIVGRTGAGKSSLAKVLFRLIHENTSGSILIDGQDISEFGVGDYRARLGMIPQESSMFDGSIRRNLDPLHQFSIEEICFGGFSSGQQQLFGLCRVIMRKRRIIVLDEATANVDLETDKSVQELIRKEFSGCTVLTIAHRLETIMNSDRIIVMDKGTVAEIGTPQELLAKDGMFAQLVKTSDFGQ
ncbi:hypothetical protein GGI17_004306 [Coemansia sp. S146]|nr:hypothetical protein GGI17_004306 [Coemansia sp. S146]